MYKNRSAGFTLIEIMVVVVIIGLLVALVAPSIFGQQERAQQVKVNADLKALETQLKLYRLHHNDYPENLKALVENVGNMPNWRPFLDKLPKDPWGRGYHYLSPGKRNTKDIDIWTYGRDGAVGGDGNDQDIGNWTN